jgi:membrane protein YqaA with SNARE-associated domain
VSEELSLTALFISGFISATLLPGGSEVLLAWQLNENIHSATSLWLAVTAGNVLGGVVTFLMGRGIAHYFPLRVFDKPRQQKAQSWIKKYGAFSLLLSWLPIIGDPICFMAGWLKTAFILSVLMLTLGKAVRYLIIVGLF